MTSISAASSNTYESPLQKLQDELQSEVNSGAVSSSDQAALSSALTDIDTALKNGDTSDQSSGTPSSPGDLQSKISDLISGEVSSGKLTSDQATELQGVFKAAFANGPGGGSGPHGAGGPGGPPSGGPPPTGGASSADGTDGSSSTDSAADILQQFLQLLQNAQAASSSTSYSASGTPASSTSASASLLINYQT
jgi:hypothetical protein